MVTAYCRHCRRPLVEGDQVHVEGARVWVIHADGPRCTFTIPVRGFC